MADTVKDYNSVGQFTRPDLSAASLGIAISSLTSSLTRTRTELTELKDGTAKAKTVRDVRREAMSVACMVPPLSDKGWLEYPKSSLFDRYGLLWVGLYEADGEWEPRDFAQGSRTTGIAMRRSFFGEGSERLVRLFQEVGPNKTAVGPVLVSKESRFVEDKGNADCCEYHKSFCRTQLKAKRLAEKFNKKLTALAGVDHTVPRVAFLDCMVYAPRDENKGRFGLLVEKRLDPAKYKKWNSNAGYVRGQKNNDGEAVFQFESFADELGMIVESDEEEGSDSEDDEEEETEKHIRHIRGPMPLSWEAADIPQAFSHFTYQHTRRKMLVCDLQGVLDDSCIPPLFELTDPAIHYRSSGGCVNVYGRTDKGEHGILDFFKTHKCSELCRMINKKWSKKSGRASSKKQ
jgi:hypothetical protein